MIKEIKRVGPHKIKMCCNNKGCPTMTDLGDGMVEITDDSGNSIIVKKEEVSLFTDGVKALNGEELLLG